jgi:hypothetical protein
MAFMVVDVTWSLSNPPLLGMILQFWEAEVSM